MKCFPSHPFNEMFHFDDKFFDVLVPGWKGDIFQRIFQVDSVHVRFLKILNKSAQLQKERQ